MSFFKSLFEPLPPGTAENNRLMNLAFVGIVSLGWLAVIMYTLGDLFNSLYRKYDDVNSKVLYLVLAVFLGPFYILYLLIKNLPYFVILK